MASLPGCGACQLPSSHVQHRTMEHPCCSRRCEASPGGPSILGVCLGDFAHPFLLPLCSFCAYAILFGMSPHRTQLCMYGLFIAARHCSVSAHHRRESNAGHVQTFSCGPQLTLARSSHRSCLRPLPFLNQFPRLSNGMSVLTHSNMKIINKVPTRVSAGKDVLFLLFERGSHVAQTCFELTICS